MDEQIHKPSEENSPEGHEHEEGETVFDPISGFFSSDERQDNTDKQGVDDHREKMALKDHFFFPDATS